MINDDFYIKLGNNIKNKRESLGITQQQLADIVGVGINHLGKIEVAYSKPSLDLLIAIAEALKVTVSQLSKFE